MSIAIERKELRRLNGLNIVGEMAAGMAHEIRNPMTTVRGYVQYISAKDTKYTQQFEIMLEELDRVNLIITEFLTLARDKKVELKRCDLNNMVHNIYPLINSDAILHNKIASIDLHTIPEILIDEKEIRQLILNLTRNGLEAMDEKKTLTIATFTDKDSTVLAIRDEGHGIDPEVLKNIGTPFVTTKSNGTGLGLAICYSIANRNHAEITIDTNTNGTTFYVAFK